LAGSLIKVGRIQPDQIPLLQEHFRPPQSETKRSFREKILACLSDPHLCHTDIIQGSDRPLALVAQSLKRENILEIPVLRVSAGLLNSTLARFLINKTIINAIHEYKRKLIVVTDDYLSDELIFALQVNGFVAQGNAWIRFASAGIEKAAGLTGMMRNIDGWFPGTKNYLEEVENTISSGMVEENRTILLREEKALWPMKMVDLDIPAFVVPIQPRWAKDLFDSDLARQTLFGSNPGLMLSLENVYYRSCRQKILDAPGRILWYVSGGKGNYQGSKSIKACSYIDEIVIDKPKILYARFRRLGIFSWRDVYDVAENNVENEIMAFRFSKTEMFKNPIDLLELRKIWQEEIGTEFYPLAPRQISTQLFFRLYRMGME